MCDEDYELERPATPVTDAAEKAHRQFCEKLVDNFWKAVEAPEKALAGVPVKETPILFTGEMVQAILAGRKTQTRRIVKPQPELHDFGVGGEAYAFVKGKHNVHNGFIAIGIKAFNNGETCNICPYGHIGDRLYVKENAWMYCEKVPNGTTKTGRPKFKYVPIRTAPVFYKQDHPQKPDVIVACGHRQNPLVWRMKVGRFMPRWASRITLEITSIRVERLNDISEADAQSEGCERPILRPGPRLGDFAGKPLYGHPMTGYYVDAYKTLWESINGKGSWEKNVFVWVIEFKRI